MNQRQLDWLLKTERIPSDALVHPSCITINDTGALYFLEDDVSWHPKTGTFMGGPILGDIDGHNFNVGPLVIHPSPLDYLRARRRGIVVTCWPGIFDYLRDLPAVSVHSSLRDKYDQFATRPLRLPEVTTYD